LITFWILYIFIHVNACILIALNFYIDAWIFELDFTP